MKYGRKYGHTPRSTGRHLIWQKEHEAYNVIIGMSIGDGRRAAKYLPTASEVGDNAARALVYIFIYLPWRGGRCI